MVVSVQGDGKLKLEVIVTLVGGEAVQAARRTASRQWRAAEVKEPTSYSISSIKLYYILAFGTARVYAANPGR